MKNFIFVLLIGASIFASNTHIYAAENDDMDIKKAGTYRFSGKMTEGIRVNTKGKVQLIFSAVSFSNIAETPVLIENAEAVTLVLEGASSIQAGAKTAIKSKAPLSIKGGGSLRIEGKDDGINAVSLNIAEASFYFNVGDDALQVEQELRIESGNFVISSGGDGIHSDNDVYIQSGEIDIRTSNEGIEGQNITIYGGNIRVVAIDDGINIAGDNLDFHKDRLAIYGGYIEVDAIADGIDSNASVYINGGTVLVHGPAGLDRNGKPNGPLDYDNTFRIDGGFLIAVGDNRMAQAPSKSSSMNSVLYTLESKQRPGTLIHIEDSSSKAIVTFRPKKAFQSFVVASPMLEKGQTYNFYIGGSVAQKDSEKGGLYTEAKYIKGNLLGSTKIAESVTYLGRRRASRR